MCTTVVSTHVTHCTVHGMARHGHGHPCAPWYMVLIEVTVMCCIWSVPSLQSSSLVYSFNHYISKTSHTQGSGRDPLRALVMSVVLSVTELSEARQIRHA